MRKSHFLVALVALCLTALAVQPAESRSLRFPQQGSTAYVLDIPDSWVVQDGGGNYYNLTAPDRSSVISLSVIVDPSVATTPLDEWAKAILESAKAEPYSRQEPAAISGVNGMAYFSRIKTGGNELADVKLVIAKTDTTHLATSSTITTATISAPQKKSLEDCLKGIKLTF